MGAGADQKVLRAAGAEQRIVEERRVVPRAEADDAAAVRAGDPRQQAAAQVIAVLREDDQLWPFATQDRGGGALSMVA